MRAGTRKAGRIASATTTVLTLDQSIAVDEGDTVSVVMPDGRVEQRDISDGDFDNKTITVSSAFSSVPATQTVYVVETSTVSAALYRVLSVTEEGELYKITALEHNESKYDFVEDGLALQQRDITTLNQTPTAPTGLNAEETLVEANNTVTTQIELSWNTVDGASGYRVSYKTENTLNYTAVGDTAYNNITFNTDEFGDFTFRVIAIGPLGKKSTPAELTQTIAGNTAAPAAVSNFSMIPVNGQAKLTWAKSVELDVVVGGYVRIRHSPDLTGVVWANTTSIAQDLPGNSTEAYVDLKTGTYLAKFVDSGGRESLTASLIEFTKPDLEDLVNVDSQQEDPTFPGSKTQLTVNGAQQELQLDFDGGSTASAGRIVDEAGDAIITEAGDDNIGQEGDSTFHTSGTYLLENNPITFSDVFSVKLDSTLRARAFFPYVGRIDDVTDFDKITDFDGDAPTGADVELYIRTTEDDPTGSPTWSSWRLFNNAEFKARAYEVKAEFSTETNTDQIAVDQLRIDSNMPSRTTRGTGTSSTSADVSVTYTNKFAATPVIGITAFDMATGDYYTVSNSAATGFDISFYNSSDTRVQREFNWTATGYGKG